jgi:HlyD family secretion protein
MYKSMKYIISLVAIAGFVFLVSCSKTVDMKKHTIQQGDFQASLMETGDLQAVVATHIVMPFLGRRYGYRQKLTGLLEHGTEVEEGDSIIALDPSNILRFLVERENRLELEKAGYNKTLVQQSTQANQLRSQLDQQEASYNMEKLALDKSRFDSEKNKLIRELEFKKAEINLNKTIKSIEYNEKIAKLDRIIKETRVKQLENDTADSHAALNRLVLRSPNKGILQIEYNRSTQQLYKAGDESYPNRPLASIPDLRRMKVISSINEVDIDKVAIGQPVRVTLDAFPDLHFNGEVSMIGRLSHRKDRESNIKIFDLEAVIEENDNEILKPGMTVSCEIIYAELRDVFYVSNDCIIREDGQYFIHLSTRGNITKTPVEVGPRNNNQTVIYGDFTKGQEVIPKDRVLPAGIQ